MPDWKYNVAVSVIASVAIVACGAMASVPAQAQNVPAQAASAAANLTAGQLDQLVAPVALYPDALLSEVLMASTYPLEVVEAGRWARQNSTLKGEALKAAAEKQGWDDSVKSLTATADVLTMMSTNLDWTQKLGDAVLAQQPDVMDAVQRLRVKAQAENKLTTTKQQKVTTTKEGNRDVVVIEPAVPNTIYVPYYDPAVVYGAWPYPAYPPAYFPPPPGYVAGAAIATGLAFGAGIAVGAWAANHNYWGGGFNWGGDNINVNRPVNINNINVNNNWQHNPDHRHGVRYNNPAVQQKFAKGDIGGGREGRLDYRGRNGNQVLQPNVNRAGAGGQNANRPGANRSGTDRPAAKRPGTDRPRANAQRPGGNRPNIAGRSAHDNAFSHIQRGSIAHAQASRGRASLGGRGAAFSRPGGGGGMRAGGGGFRGGGRGGGGFHRR